MVNSTTSTDRPEYPRHEAAEQPVPNRSSSWSDRMVRWFDSNDNDGVLLKIFKVFVCALGLPIAFITTVTGVVLCFTPLLPVGASMAGVGGASLPFFWKLWNGVDSAPILEEQDRQESASSTEELNSDFETDESQSEGEIYSSSSDSANRENINDYEEGYIHDAESSASSPTGITDSMGNIDSDEE